MSRMVKKPNLCLDKNGDIYEVDFWKSLYLSNTRTHTQTHAHTPEYNLKVLKGEIVELEHLEVTE